MQKLLYGVAYYDEYMPYDRLDDDIRMMQAAGINVVRIAELTWSTHEPQNGVFDFRSVDRVLDAMHQAGISVIVGTPTYAIPTWMVRQHPDVLAITPQGPGRYGARQIMDITNPTYLFYAERIIRPLIGQVSEHPAVIGYQTDNETKHYHTCRPECSAPICEIHARTIWQLGRDQPHVRAGLLEQPDQQLGRFPFDGRHDQRQPGR